MMMTKKNVRVNYMSLASILQGYSQDIQAKEAHNDEVDQEISSRKANTIEEQFNNHLDHINSGAMDLGGASTAFHLGRKVYKAYRDAKNTLAAKKAELGKVKSDPDTPTGEDGSVVRPNPNEFPKGLNEAESRAYFQANPNVVNPKGVVQFKAEADAPERPFPEAPTERVVPAQAGQSESGATTTSSGASSGGDATPSAQAPAQAQAPTQASQADVSGVADSSQSRTSLSTRAIQPAEDPLKQGTSNLFSEPRSLGQSGHVNPNQGGAGKPAEPAPASEPTTQTSTLDSQVGRQVANPAEMGNVGADSERTIGSVVRDGANNMARQVGSAVSNTAKKVLPESVNSALDSGLITSDAVLDSIPVVGEVASVITGLIGLFEGVGHKPDPDKEGQTEASAPATASSGIDPDSVQKSQASTTTATIV